MSTLNNSNSIFFLLKKNPEKPKSNFLYSKTAVYINNKPFSTQSSKHSTKNLTIPVIQLDLGDIKKMLISRSFRWEKC